MAKGLFGLFKHSSKKDEESVKLVENDKQTDKSGKQSAKAAKNDKAEKKQPTNKKAKQPEVVTPTKEDKRAKDQLAADDEEKSAKSQTIIDVASDGTMQVTSAADSEATTASNKQQSTNTEAQPAQSQSKDQQNQQSEQATEPVDEEPISNSNVPVILSRPIIVSFFYRKRKIANDFVFTGKLGKRLTLDDLPKIKGYKFAEQQKFKYAITQNTQRVTVEMVRDLVNYQIVPVDESGRMIDSTYTESHQGQLGTAIPPKIMPTVPGYQPNLGRKYLISKGTVKITYLSDDQTVLVSYITTTGETLEEEQIQGKTGDTYRIKPEEHRFEGYELASTPDSLKGRFEPGNQTVTIKYEPVSSSITVNFLDDSGQELRHPLSFTGHFGDRYNLETTGMPVIDGYELVSDPSQMVGTYAVEPKQISLRYERAPQHFRIRYWFDKGHHQSAGEDSPMTGLTGDFYKVIPPKLDGYEAHPSVIEGKYDAFKNPDVNVVYVRQRSHLQINFEDETGRVISGLSPIKKVGNMGSHYKIQLPLINGYKAPKQYLTGKYRLKQETRIVYYQAEPALVEIQYIDAETNRPIEGLESKSLHGPVGTAYNIEPRMIDGYTLKELPENASGVFRVRNQQVVLEYQPNVSQVIVECRDRANNLLQKPIVLKGHYGQNYHLKPEQLKPIEGYTLQNDYHLLNGRFPKNRKVVKLYFTAKPIRFKLVAVDQFKKVIDHKYDIEISGLPGQKFSHGLPQIPGYTSDAIDVGSVIRPGMNGNELKIQYRPNAASVIFHFLCKGGPHDQANPYPDYELDGRTGDPFEYEVPAVTGYAPQQQVIKGKYQPMPQNIEIVYQVQSENYTISFVDKNGKIIDRSPAGHGVYGQLVDIDNAIPHGYHLPAGTEKTISLSGQSSYQVKIIPNTVLVRLTSQTADGKDLNYNRQLSGDYHQEQQIQVPIISGYRPVKGSTITIKFDPNEQEIPVIYEPEPRQITVRFMDTQGNNLRKPQVVKGRYEEHYQIRAPQIQGYFPVSDQEKKGHFGLNDEELAFIYRAGSDELNHAITPLEDLMVDDDAEVTPETQVVRGDEVNGQAFAGENGEEVNAFSADNGEVVHVEESSDTTSDDDDSGWDSDDSYDDDNYEDYEDDDDDWDDDNADDTGAADSVINDPNDSQQN